MSDHTEYFEVNQYRKHPSSTAVVAVWLTEHIPFSLHNIIFSTLQAYHCHVGNLTLRIIWTLSLQESTEPPLSKDEWTPTNCKTRLHRAICSDTVPVEKSHFTQSDMGQSLHITGTNHFLVLLLIHASTTSSKTCGFFSRPQSKVQLEIHTYVISHTTSSYQLSGRRRWLAVHHSCATPNPVQPHHNTNSVTLWTAAGLLPPQPS